MRKSKTKISIVKDGALTAKSASNEQLQITPKGILFACLCDVFGIGKDTKSFRRDIKRTDKFITKLLEGLSSLATDGKDSTVFGADFSDFFALVVKTLNEAGKLHKLLDENGIEIPDDEEESKS